MQDLHLRVGHPGLEPGLAIESGQFARMVPTHDIRKALDAWIGRRKPEYQGPQRMIRTRRAAWRKV